ncbi:MAG TPA: alpha/beta hydrolase-fold protein [Chitinophagaceae bacterium]|jgi:enterochelin esterase-like enzyme|nr:alpha/beta hydrolase-fold protein [Chitinophagaceae bacterium]
MSAAELSSILIENIVIHSQFLRRDVKVDFFVPKNIIDPSQMSLLLINDGQNMKELGLKSILENLYAENLITPILCVAIHAGNERKMEYGTAIQADYLGRGAKAGLYTLFITHEILPLIKKKYNQFQFREKGFAGFSLGGLMALDIVWNYPNEFSKAGIFSGSLWWRSLDHTHDEYEDELHRIMHQQIKKGKYNSGLKFFLTTGSFDETNDRNNNGIIDSIDDTLALIDDLESLGYENGKDIIYINYKDGKHDIATWARAMPEFLKWGWGKNV